MRRLCAVLLAAVFILGASPAYACHDGYGRYSHHSDRYGYYDDDCDSSGYYCDGYGWYRSDRDDYRYHRRYYRDSGGSCVYHQQVGAISVDFLCRYAY